MTLGRRHQATRSHENIDMTSASPTSALPILARRGVCPLCGGASSQTEIAFKGIPVVRCSTCGFLYSSRVMTDEGLATYYAQQVANERLVQGQQVFAQASLAALERITPLRRLRRTLDVGAGYGFLLSFLQTRHGIQGVGVEPSVVESDFGCSQLGVDIRPVLLREAALDRAAFDLVCSFEVLEHTLDPVGFVAELSEYVAPGGYLVIGTDNFESGVVRALGPGFPKWIPHTHVSHFAPATLTTLTQYLQGFVIYGYTSYTPWEFQARRLLSPVRRNPTAPETYDFASELNREVSRTFKFYHLRRAVTRVWFKYTATSDLSGEMMYIALQKRDT